MSSAALRPAKRRPPGPNAVSAAGQVLQYLPLASIDLVANTRTHYDETALAELTESIRAQGVLQSVLVRPSAVAGRYELAAGHRRYLAAQAAGLTEIPAGIRALTDRQFLEVQLLENLQRQDVAPADEAVAFARLLENDFSAAEIGQKVGKSARFVAQRAALAVLEPYWMAALRAGRLPLVAANELARLPAAGQQRMQEAAAADYTYRRDDTVFAAHWVNQNIKQHVLRELHSAAFPKHDATLYPMAGACTACPKRSAAYQQLFDEEEQRHDLCLDGPCFQKKKYFFVERRTKELRAETGQKPVLVSSTYYANHADKSVLTEAKYRKVKAETPGAVQALVVDGSEAGHLAWVQLNESREAVQGQKADRSAEIRAGKVSAAARQLMAVAVLHKSQDSGRVLEALLDDRLRGELRSNGGPHTPLRLLLAQDFGFGWPEGGEAALRKLTPMANFEGLRAWEKQNLSTFSYAQKLFLYFALLAYNASSCDSANGTLAGYARAAGADVEALLDRAGQLVDGTYEKALVDMSEAELDATLAAAAEKITKGGVAVG